MPIFFGSPGPFIKGYGRGEGTPPISQKNVWITFLISRTPPSNFLSCSHKNLSPFLLLPEMEQTLKKRRSLKVIQQNESIFKGILKSFLLSACENPLVEGLSPLLTRPQWKILKWCGKGRKLCHPNTSASFLYFKNGGGFRSIVGKMVVPLEALWAEGSDPLSLDTPGLVSPLLKLGSYPSKTLRVLQPLNQLKRLLS